MENATVRKYKYTDCIARFVHLMESIEDGGNVVMLKIGTTSANAVLDIFNHLTILDWTFWTS